MTSARIDNGTILLGEPMIDGRLTLTSDDTTRPPGDEFVADVYLFDDDDEFDDDKEEEDLDEFEDEDLDEDEFDEDDLDDDEFDDDDDDEDDDEFEDEF